MIRPRRPLVRHLPRPCAVHGVFDNVPWLICLRRRSHRQRPVSRLSLLLCGSLVLGLSLVRLFSVVGQPPLTDYLYSFAPTPRAMWTNFFMGCAYLLLFLCTCAPSVVGRRRCAAAAAFLRPLRVPRDCRGWLALLALSYTGTSLGYVLFVTCGISPIQSLWIGEAFLYVYAALYGPALYYTFQQIAPDWLGSGSSLARVSGSSTGSGALGGVAVDGGGGGALPRPRAGRACARRTRSASWGGAAAAARRRTPSSRRAA